MKRFTKTRALPWPRVVFDIAQIEIEFLRELLYMVNTMRDKHLKKIQERATEVGKEDFRIKQDYKEYIDILSDDYRFMNEVVNQAERLSIIGLYTIVELSTKKILSWPYHGNEKKIKETHKWYRLKANLENDFRFDLSSVVSYATIDELRCLNNDIKHEGIVSEELAKFSGWKKGEEIRNLRPHFDRFAVHVPKYLADFVEKLNDKLA